MLCEETQEDLLDTLMQQISSNEVVSGYPDDQLDASGYSSSQNEESASPSQSHRSQDIDPSSQSQDSASSLPEATCSSPVNENPGSPSSAEGSSQLEKLNDSISEKVDIDPPALVKESLTSRPLLLNSKSKRLSISTQFEKQHLKKRKIISSPSVDDLPSKSPSPGNAIPVEENDSASARKSEDGASPTVEGDTEPPPFLQEEDSSTTMREEYLNKNLSPSAAVPAQCDDVAFLSEGDDAKSPACKESNNSSAVPDDPSFVQEHVESSVCQDDDDSSAAPDNPSLSREDTKSPNHIEGAKSSPMRDDTSALLLTEDDDRIENSKSVPSPTTIEAHSDGEETVTPCQQDERDSPSHGNDSPPPTDISEPGHPSVCEMFTDDVNMENSDPEMSEDIYIPLLPPRPMTIPSPVNMEVNTENESVNEDTNEHNRNLNSGHSSVQNLVPGISQDMLKQEEIELDDRYLDDEMRQNDDISYSEHPKPESSPQDDMCDDDVDVGKTSPPVQENNGGPALDFDLPVPGRSTDESTNAAVMDVDLAVPGRSTDDPMENDGPNPNPTEVVQFDSVEIASSVDDNDQENPNEIDIHSLLNKTPPGFSCRGCQKSFTVERFFKQHWDRVTSKCKYDCKACKSEVTFMNVCRLKSHLKNHGSRPLIVSRLNLSLPSVKEFILRFMSEFRQPICSRYEKYLEAVKNDETKVVECPQCYEMVPSLREHFTEGAEGVNFSVNLWCPICKFMLPTQCAMDSHKRIHNQEGPYICPECGRRFVTWNFFDRHLLRECFHYYRRLRMRCLICGEVIPCGQDAQDIHQYLVEHIKANHVVNLFKCTVCNALFKLMKDVYPHLESAHDMNPGSVSLSVNECKYSQCPLCPGTTLVPSKKLGTHIQKHFGDTAHRVYGFQCEECKTFTGVKERFVKHLEARHPKNPSPVNYRKRQGTTSFDIPKRLKMSSPPDVFKPISMTRVPKEPSTPKATLIRMPPPPSVVAIQKSPGVAGPSKVEIPKVSKVEIPKVSKVENTKVKKVENTKVIKFLKCHLCCLIFEDDLLKVHFEKYHKIKCPPSFYNSYVTIVVGPTVGKMWKPNSSRSAEDENESEFMGDNLEPDDKSPLDCLTCDYKGTSLEDLKKHFLTHRNPGCWQCMECGKCFCTSSSLGIHLVTTHQVTDPKKYMHTNKVHDTEEAHPETLKEHQCSECLLELPDNNALQSHFRKHGLAFLKKIKKV